MGGGRFSRNNFNNFLSILRSYFLKKSLFETFFFQGYPVKNFSGRETWVEFPLLQSVTNKELKRKNYIFLYNLIILLIKLLKVLVGTQSKYQTSFKRNLENVYFRCNTSSFYFLIFGVPLGVYHPISPLKSDSHQIFILNIFTPSNLLIRI